MFISFLLDACGIEHPTIKGGRAEHKDSDAEEQVFVGRAPVETVCHQTQIIDVGGQKRSMTLALLGCRDRFLGIKVTVFNRQTVREDGVFFKITDTEQWAPNEHQLEAFNALGKAKKSDVLRYKYTLAETLLNKGGFRRVFERVKYNENREPYLRGIDDEKTKVGCLLKRDLE